MFIKRENAIKAIDAYAQAAYEEGEQRKGSAADYCAVLVESVQEECVVRIEQYNKLNFQLNVLRALLNGEWVNCDDVQEAMCLTFEQCKELFEYGVCGPWNGERIGEKFRLRTDVVSQPNQDTKYKVDNPQLELIYEQQGGII